MKIGVVLSKNGFKLHWNPEKFNAEGGFFDYIGVCLALIHNNPDWTFYFLSATDSKDLSAEQKKVLFPADNVVFVRDLYAPKGVDFSDLKQVKEIWQPFLWNWFQKEGIRPDFGVIDTGPSALRTALVEELPSERKETKAIPASMARLHLTPVVHFLNQWPGHWAGLIFDTRNFISQKDLYNLPLYSFSQINQKTEKTVYQNGTFQKILLDQTYAHLEKSAVIGTSPLPLEELLKQKTRTFGLVCHQRPDGGDVRERIVSEYVLKPFSGDEVEIYGKWPEEWSRKYSAFKGVVPKAQLGERIRSWKYSLCVPLQKSWQTAKYLELILEGIVPFLHPDYYSSENDFLPEFLKVTSGADLKAKIEYLEQNSRYEKLISILYKKATDAALMEGLFLNNMICSSFVPDYIEKTSCESIRNIWTRFREATEQPGELDFLW